MIMNYDHLLYFFVLCCFFLIQVDRAAELRWLALVESMQTSCRGYEHAVLSSKTFPLIAIQAIRFAYTVMRFYGSL